MPRSRKPSSAAFYVPSSKIYGWRPSYETNPSEKIRKANTKMNQSDEDKEFVNTFWQSTSQAYGSFGYEKNTLCSAMEDLKSVKAAKHVSRNGDGPAPPNESKHAVDLSFQNYQLARKPEHKIYTTTSNDIGSKKPQFDTKLYPHMNQFTNTFLAGMQRDCGLNTTIAKHRYHDEA
ncbi:Hypothetical Protein FCC1311_066482 [Hondaea fermentalgiana]|uniref:Uncharacterized protein n=1 Tax=Hondaea fermentalgiana TaxID=2315210 RepID=A0A2R5GJD8_9STRA|nr:Hypothetical Protein FCC1311_066482 [Hondaea fermentalgiana]|eukprot:GBG30429.1 Hypothetical Protein FCC1311_066482 [Hondaea fermentalgiana]